MEDEDDDFWDLAILAVLTAVANYVSEEEEDLMAVDETPPSDHRTEPRSARRGFDHGRAYMCIMNDYLGPEPLYGDGGFQSIFRVTKQRFQRIYDDIQASNNEFFFPSSPRAKVTPFARLLYPLKTLAYGVSRTAFEDYYQLSTTFAANCSAAFDVAMCTLYTKEYLRQPTAVDLQQIERLHHHQHGIRGMLGSLDCMHVTWKNCPKAWQGSFTGKEKKPTIVLESVCDYNLWFWYTFFGAGGSYNDLNVLDTSNLLMMIVKGILEALEKESGIVPFKINGDDFDKLFYLVDGIYPLYSRFVKGIKDPTNQADKKYTEWQESARKDIERAFGVLQIRFQWTARPVQLHSLDDISRRMKACLILHNMGVSDRVMDNDVYAVYDPLNGRDTEDVVEEEEGDAAIVGVANVVGADADLANQRWQALTDEYEHQRLLNAIRLELNS